jgi:hypothetical protein
MKNETDPKATLMALEPRESDMSAPEQYKEEEHPHPALC